MYSQNLFGSGILGLMSRSTMRKVTEILGMAVLAGMAISMARLLLQR